MTHYDDPYAARHIVSIAKRIARKRYKEILRKQGHRISLTPINLGAIHNRMLKENGGIWDEAKREYERLRPQLETNPRRARKARKGDVGSSGAMEAKPV
jgi:hypothetical protein